MRGLKLKAAVLSLVILAATDLHAAVGAPPGTTYTIVGKHSVYGAYHGELEVRQRNDAHVDVIRSITFDDFKFEGKRVRETWSGIGELHRGRLSLNFQLKQADVFERVDDLTRTSEQFQTKIAVPYSIDLKKDSTGGAVSLEGTFDERVGDSRDSAIEPIWKEDKQAVKSFGDCFQTVGFWAMTTIFLPITMKYRTCELTAPSAQRAEFLSRNQYFVLDHTNFDLLRKQPDLICIDNKLADKISLVEESLRTGAFGCTLRQKQEAFDRDMVMNHINELGLFSGMVIEPGGRKVYVPNGDGALWSGMYAGSQAMRWLVTKDPEALANFKKVTKGLMLLMDLTGSPTEFARTAERLRPGEVLNQEWRATKDIKYLLGGNNDMVKGLFHAFVWAYEILPAGDPLLLELDEHAKRMVNLRVAAKEKNHPGNYFSASGLAALASGRKEDLHHYLQFYHGVMKPIDFLNLDKGFYFGGIADWSGVNLGMVSQVTDILIAKNLLAKFSETAEEKKELKAVLINLRRRLMNSWGVYADARRDFVTLAADTFAASDPPLLKFPVETTPKTWCSQNKWAEHRRRAMWLLREIPITGTNHFVRFDYRLKPEWCASAWPRLPWKSFTENPPMEFHLQGAYDYPAFQGSALESDNLWTSAFQFRGQASGQNQPGRTDYLHVYWMGKLSGLIRDDD